MLEEDILSQPILNSMFAQNRSLRPSSLNVSFIRQAWARRTKIRTGAPLGSFLCDFLSR